MIFGTEYELDKAILASKWESNLFSGKQQIPTPFPKRILHRDDDRTTNRKGKRVYPYYYLMPSTPGDRSGITAYVVTGDNKSEYYVNAVLTPYTIDEAGKAAAGAAETAAAAAAGARAAIHAMVHDTIARYGIRVLADRNYLLLNKQTHCNGLFQSAWLNMCHEFQGQMWWRIQSGDPTCTILPLEWAKVHGWVSTGHQLIIARLCELDLTVQEQALRRRQNRTLSTYNATTQRSTFRSGDAYTYANADADYSDYYIVLPEDLIRLGLEYLVCPRWKYVINQDHPRRELDESCLNEGFLYKHFFPDNNWGACCPDGYCDECIRINAFADDTVEEDLDDDEDGMERLLMTVEQRLQLDTEVADLRRGNLELETGEWVLRTAGFSPQRMSDGDDAAALENAGRAYQTGIPPHENDFSQWALQNHDGPQYGQIEEQRYQDQRDRNDTLDQRGLTRFNPFDTMFNFALNSLGHIWWQGFATTYTQFDAIRNDARFNAQFRRAGYQWPPMDIRRVTRVVKNLPFVLAYIATAEASGPTVTATPMFVISTPMAGIIAVVTLLVLFFTLPGSGGGRRRTTFMKSEPGIAQSTEPASEQDDTVQQLVKSESRRRTTCSLVAASAMTIATIMTWWYSELPWQVQAAAYMAVDMIVLIWTGQFNGTSAFWIHRIITEYLITGLGAVRFACEVADRQRTCDGAKNVNGLHIQCNRKSEEYALVQDQGRYFCVDCATHEQEYDENAVGYSGKPPTADDHSMCGVKSMILVAYFRLQTFIAECQGNAYWTTGEAYWAKRRRTTLLCIAFVTVLFIGTVHVGMAMVMALPLALYAVAYPQLAAPTANEAMLTSTMSATILTMHNTVLPSTTVISAGVTAVSMLFTVTMTLSILVLVYMASQPKSAMRWPMIIAVVAAIAAQYETDNDHSTYTARPRLRGGAQEEQTLVAQDHPPLRVTVRDVYTIQPHHAQATAFVASTTTPQHNEATGTTGEWSKEILFRPDTMASYPVVNDVNLLHTITSSQPGGCRGIGEAVVTHVGEMYISAADSEGNMRTVNLKEVQVIPTSPANLLGNYARHSDLYYLSDRNGQSMDFNGINIPVIMENYLVHFAAVAHSAAIPKITRKPVAVDELMPPQKVAEQTAQPQPLDDGKCYTDGRTTVAEYFGGCGMGSAAMDNQCFNTKCYFDSDTEAAAVFKYNNPQVPIDGNFEQVVGQRGEDSFLHRAKQCDMAWCGPPCNNTSVLNPNRQCHSDNAYLLVDQLQLIRKANHKLVVVEAPPSILHSNNEHLLAQFQDEALSQSPQYTVNMHTVNPLDHGGVQDRPRVYFTLVRRDVEDQLGPFPEITPTAVSSRSIRDILEPIENLDIASLISYNQYTHRPGYTPHTGKPRPVFQKVGTQHGPHRFAYSVDGPLPTMTTKPIVIFDDRIGEFRRLTIGELLAGQSQLDMQFPPTTTVSKAAEFVGRGMDGTAVAVVANAARSYLSRMDVAQPAAFMMTPLALHECNGHPTKEKSKLMHIPYPKDGCPICPNGKIKKAASTGDTRPKADKPLDVVFTDIKVSSVADRNNIQYCCGFVDSCTGMSWVYPLSTPSSDEVIKVMEELRVQELGGRQIGTLVMDNGSCYTSAQFKQYLTSINSKRCYSSAFHQHMNGPAESLWNRCNPLVTLQLMQSPHLGEDYWFECYKHANDQLIHTPSRAHNGRSPKFTVRRPQRRT